MKKVILLIMTALVLTGCKVKEQEMELTVFHNTVNSVYTGKVKHKLADGEGTAALANDASVQGIFEQGAFISGAAAAVPYSAAYDSSTLTGTYTGEVADQLPTGQGTFEADAFSYNGTWANGVMEGTGTINTDNFHIGTNSETLEGSYSGDIVKGLAEGTGTFTYQNGNDEIEFSGNFTGNQFDGTLVKTIRYQDTVKSFPVYYRNGKQLHTPLAMIAYMEGMRKDSYCLSEAEAAFLSEHASLFEGKGTEKDAPAGTTFDYKGFKDDSTPALIRIDNALIKSIQRYKPYEGADTVTSMIIQNTDGWYHLVFAYSVDSVDPGDTADFIALPLCHSTLTSPEEDYDAIDAAGAAVLTDKS